MKQFIFGILAITLISIVACSDNEFDREVVIPQFNFPKTVVFEDSLSSYSIFKGNQSDLLPADDFHLLELGSVLFSNYSYKQRLVKVPQGSQIDRLDDGSIEFPNGTLLTKTFYYFNNEQNTSLGKRIIETRLLIKQSDIWNVATYIWNEEQTDAMLELDGLQTQVNWIDSNGENISILYQVPTENECTTCHQSNSSMTPLGTKLRNLNRLVDRNGITVNQLAHLQSVGILSDFPLIEIPTIEDYPNTTASLNNRARAYLEMNCAHCHNPNAWQEPARQDLDLRYEIALDQTGIIEKSDDIMRSVIEGEMPFIGTTVLDKEGANLIVEYIESL